MTQQYRVRVLDKNRQPVPCYLARTRELLRKGKAAVFRRYSFTIILKEYEGGEVQPAQIKIDPGSQKMVQFQGFMSSIWQYCTDPMIILI